MFSSKSQLRKRTPENGSDRENYLSLLVDEYIHSTSYDAKSQVLANLANFAYDPINFGYIRNVGVLDIFFHVLKNEQNNNLLHFAATGICNLCIDPANVDYILNNENLKSISMLLHSKHEETVADAITIFIYLYDSHARTAIDELNLQTHVQTLMKSDNKGISNLSNILFENLGKSDKKTESK